MKHWHHAYLETKAEQERLKNAIFDLYCWKEAALAAPPPAKRKAPDEIDETLDTDGKRAKLAVVENESQQDPVTQGPQVPQVTGNPKPEQSMAWLAAGSIPRKGQSLISLTKHRQILLEMHCRA